MIIFHLSHYLSNKNFCFLFFILTGLTYTSAQDLTTVRAMTFNIRCPCGDQNQFSWDVRKDLVVDVIKSYSPDFLGTQENVNNYQDFLEEEIPEYSFFGRGRNSDGGGEGTQLYYLKDRWEVVEGDSGTFQMSLTPEVWGSVSWSSLPRITTWGLFREKTTGKLIYVYNTHWDHQTGRDEFSKMTADSLATRKHLDAPLLLMGDFNQRQTQNSIRYLLGEDVFSDKEPVVSLHDTHPQVSKIDHIFMWPEESTIDSLPMTVLDAKVVAERYDVGQWTNVSPSDHDPTLADIKVWDNVPLSLSKQPNVNHPVLFNDRFISASKNIAHFTNFKVKVYNLSGALIFSAMSTDNKDIALPSTITTPGLYFIKIEGDGLN